MCAKCKHLQTKHTGRSFLNCTLAKLVRVKRVKDTNSTFYSDILRYVSTTHQNPEFYLPMTSRLLSVARLIFLRGGVYASTAKANGWAQVYVFLSWFPLTSNMNRFCFENLANIELCFDALLVHFGGVSLPNRKQLKKRRSIV